MKNNEKQNQDVMAVYDAYWETYLRGDIKNWASLVDDDFRIIGTTDGEIFYNKKEALAFYEATADQIAGKAEIRNSVRKTKSWDGLNLITEIADLYILIETEWTFYSKFRLSSLLRKKQDGWKFIQQHGSIPDTRAKEGEQAAFQKIKQENLDLRDAVKRRTIELENKNRELEIEGSLERVRTIALSMRTPSDMLDVCQTISQQLELLNITDIRNIQTVIVDESKGTYLNYQYFTAYDKTVIEETEYEKHPTVLAMVQEMKKSADAYFSGIFQDEELEAFREYRERDNQFDDPLLAETNSVHYYFFSIGKGGLGLTTYKPIPASGIEIFKRFHKAFQLAYRRFIDIEKAEAQAREARIELSLERIRAQVTAMQQSSDLLDIVVMLQAEFIKLGHEAHYFWHMRWLPDKYEKALTNGDGTRIGNVLELPRGFHGLQNMLDWEKSDEPSGVFALDPETAADYIDKMIKLGRFQEIDHSAPDPDGVRTMGGLTFVMARTTHGEIGYTLPGEVPHPPEEDIATLVRFAGVFDLAYRRFEDLQSAERQNRVIRAENERKGKELEEARQMQLSMLPKEIPQFKNLEIAVHMQTATEVGGDYYDFSFRDDGSINIALGDATGHGMKAGIMVSSMKSIFTTNSPKMNIDDFFRTANSGIKSMNLKRMMMGFTMLNINSHHFQLINAGMPPVFLYKKNSKTVEEIKDHCVPIGAMNHIQFRTTHGSLEKGDVLLLLTDGMPELHNKNEMYGYKRIRDSFKKVAEKEPEKIVGFLNNEGSAWIDDRDPEDDVTFVVIKAI